MGRSKPTPVRKDPLQETRDYLAFLEKRLASEHYRKNVTPEEYAKTRTACEKARLRVRILGMEKNPRK